MNKPCYPNLRAEMMRDGITVSELSAAIGAKRPTVYRWISGEGTIRLKDAIYIRDKFFPDKSIDYLFGTV